VRNIVAAHQCSNPLFLKTLLEELRIFGSFEELNKQIADYLKADSPPALFQKVFARLEADYQSQKAGMPTFIITFFHLISYLLFLVKKVLCVTCCRHYGHQGKVFPSKSCLSYYRFHKRYSRLS